MNAFCVLHQQAFYFWSRSQSLRNCTFSCGGKRLQCRKEPLENLDSSGAQGVAIAVSHPAPGDKLLLLREVQ